MALDLYLAYLRAAFNTCYYCSVTTDHVEELQRKCIQHIRKPMPKPVAAPAVSEEQKPEVKMDTEPSAKEETKEDGGEKQADAQKEKEKEKKDNASKSGKERHSGKFSLFDVREKEF